MTTIAIIGAGPSGVTTAKSALECGLIPTVLEKGDAVGGVWKGSHGYPWNSMNANVSHFTISFSDFPYDKSVPAYPHQMQVAQYLSNYADYFQLGKYLHFNCNVQKVCQVGKKWRVDWINGDNQFQFDIFDFVVVATGLYTKSYIPPFEGIEKFQGAIVTANQYKSPEALSGKTVLVIGNAFSGCEIASEQSTTAKRVIHMFRRPFWILPRYVPKSADKNEKLPWDLVFYNRSGPINFKANSVDELFLQINNWFRQVCGQDSIDERLKMNGDFKEPPFFTISDTYLEAVKSKRVQLKVSGLKGFTETGVVFEDGTSENFDAVIVCTGYRTGFPFFDVSILKELEYQRACKYQPVLLHKTVFPRNLPGLAFVGLVCPPYFAIVELQAKWACMVFSGKLKHPTKEEIENGITQEGNIRLLKNRPQFAHADLIGTCDDLAAQIGIKLDFDRMQKENPNLHKKLYHGPFSPSVYSLYGMADKNCMSLAVDNIDQLIRFTHDFPKN